MRIRVITARVRSTRECNVLTPVCVSVHTWGGTQSQVWPGGVPHPRSGQEEGGTPSQVWRGVPYHRSGWRGYPIPGLDRGYLGYPPLWTWDRVSPPDLGWGTPLDLGWGTPPRPDTEYPPPDLGLGTPPGTGYPPPSIVNT